MTKEGLLGFFPQLTHKRYRDLIRAFSTIDRAWEASYSDLKHHTPWKEELIQQFLSWKKMLDITAITDSLTKERITVIPFSDPAYPALLKEIHDPPPCLFVRGNLQTKNTAIAVVGTRKPSRYGRDVATQFVRELAEHKISIVSGLALGIDAVVHEAAVAHHGHTIAVLGSGIDTLSIAPQTNLGLAESIIHNGGTIISEYPPGTSATPYTFPRRNRIIAGLCRGTLVIEAGPSSGALITAHCAIEYNREVFAIPQQIGAPTGMGANNLIKQGAILVTDISDILTPLHIDAESNKKTIHTQSTPLPPLSETESTIYSYISQEPKSIDAIIRESLLAQTLVTTTVTLLELKGIIRHIGGTLYVRT